MPGRLSLTVAGFLLSEGLVVALIALFFPEIPLSACTDVGYTGDEPPGGFEFYEFYLGWMGYSPDGGVNRFDTPIVTIAVGLLAVGGTILGIDRWNWELLCLYLPIQPFVMWLEWVYKKYRMTSPLRC